MRQSAGSKRRVFAVATMPQARAKIARLAAPAFPRAEPAPIRADFMGELSPSILWRRELRATLLLAAPLAAANLAQMLVYAVDVIFVARLGEQALAAS